MFGRFVTSFQQAVNNLLQHCYTTLFRQFVKFLLYHDCTSAVFRFYFRTKDMKKLDSYINLTLLRTTKNSFSSGIRTRIATSSQGQINMNLVCQNNLVTSLIITSSLLQVVNRLCKLLQRTELVCGLVRFYVFMHENA